MMRLAHKSSTFPYKSLIGYTLGVAAILLLAVPVLANTRPGTPLLDFSRSSNTGLTIQSAQTLSKGVNINHLNPGQENWYAYSRTSFNDPEFSWVSLALRVESEALIGAEQVNFEVFTQPDSTGWFQPAAAPGDVLGSGLSSPLQAGGPKLETFWTGHVEESNQYLVRVYNNSPFGLDYTLEAKAEQAAVSGATPASFNGSASAIPANSRQLAWTLTAQAVENMSAVEAADWMKKAQAVGWIVTAGTTPDALRNPAEADPHTLWQLTAEAIDGQDAQTAAQWLIQADSMGWLSIPLGTVKNPFEDVVEETSGGGDGGASGETEPAAVPVQPDDVYQPVNIYPNKPLPFDLNHVNSGRLAPYGEHWYELTRDNLDGNLIENMKMSMFFTPIQGYMSNRINFEIFPAGQLHIWQRGDADYMENLGAGMWVSRDNDPNTGERLWNGSLVDGDRYLVKVKNGTPEEVDYYLFPNDVTNAELGNPTLHQVGVSGGPMPYMASPPSRPGPPPKPGDAPPEAIPLDVGTTLDTLQAGQEMWYSFFYRDPNNDSSATHDFKIYLTNTPLDNVRARHADFEIYPGNQLHLWTRGTIDALDPVGASAPSPYPLKNNQSLQVLWDGQLMEGQLYYVKVYNHDIGPLKYELKISGGP